MLTSSERDKLTKFGLALINQEKAKPIILPNENKIGFWFGGGNMVLDSKGNFYLVGRYRNFGDSRTGLGLGERGLELAIFKSTDNAKTFSKVVLFSKADLNVDNKQVLSIEGSALNFTDQGVELFISSEKKNIPYPNGLESFLKIGAGVWTIEHIKAKSIEQLSDAPIKTIVSCSDPQWFHVKDPFISTQSNGDILLGFVTHSFNWSSANAGYTFRRKNSDKFESPNYNFFKRGNTWDVAMSRITSWMNVPQLGSFAKRSPLTLLFYDGGESMRNMDEHAKAVNRPRGYSCEELGGMAVGDESGVNEIERLSKNLPSFISPYGIGTSRYVDILETEDGYYATWQQSQKDYSQPLVMNFLSNEEAQDILS